MLSWFYCRETDLTHLQRERCVSRRGMGEILLLQKHRGARDLLGSSPHLSSDRRADRRLSGGLQEQKGVGSSCHLQHNPKKDVM